MKSALFVLFLMLVGCGSDPEVILDTDPFLTAQIPNPPDDEAGILKRSSDFARQNGMKIEQSTSHFEAGEYSALLKRSDLNIVISNVGRGRTTYLTAYVRGNVTDAQRKLVGQFQCAVFYACNQQRKRVG